jgi:hypothetical protein
MAMTKRRQASCVNPQCDGKLLERCGKLAEGANRYANGFILTGTVIWNHNPPLFCGAKRKFQIAGLFEVKKEIPF